PEEHLRRHTRPSHLEPARMGGDEDARGNRAGAVQSDSQTLVAVHQPVSGVLGPERLPAALPEVRYLCDPRRVRAGRRDPLEAMMSTRTRNPPDSRRSSFSAWAAFSAVVLFIVGIVAQGAAPVIVVETSKGTFSIETFPEDAPKTVAHIVELASRGFYDGQRVHRALPGFLVQWGDPRSTDAARESEWGFGRAASSGRPIGVGEITKKRTNV